MSRSHLPPVPRLHVVTDGGILEDEAFPSRARRALEAGGPDVALHLRAPGASGRFLFQRTRPLLEPAGEHGALVLVNDRLDVALAAGAPGGQVGERSLPVREAREVLGRRRLLGASVHDRAAAATAVADGADFLLLGTIYRTASHPDRAGAGPGLVREVALHLRDTPSGFGGPGPRPLVAIGGVTASRIAEVLGAGAHGVAVVRAVWNARDPGGAVRELVEALDRGAHDEEGDP